MVKEVGVHMKWMTLTVMSEVQINMIHRNSAKQKLLTVLQNRQIIVNGTARERKKNRFQPKRAKQSRS